MRAFAGRPELTPLAVLRVRTPRLELRLGTHAEVLALAELAAAGIHPPGEMPFASAWTDGAGTPGFVERFATFHEDQLAGWTPDDWTLNLLVWEGDTLAGTQGVSGAQFATKRTVATGSWLGHGHQGRGVGTEMRAAVLELAFVWLGAEAATSSWMKGNDASRRVSEKLGYEVVEETTQSPRPGESVRAWNVRRERAGWRSPVPVTVDGIEPSLPLFGVEGRPTDVPGQPVGRER